MVGDLPHYPQTMSWLIPPGWRPSGHHWALALSASREVPVQARNARVCELAVQRPGGYPDTEPAASAAVADCVGGEFVRDEHDVSGTAFRHARGHRAADGRFAQYVEGTRVEFLF